MTNFLRKFLIIFALILILKPWCSQPLLDADPGTITIYIDDVEVLTLDPNTNSIGGAGCIDSFVFR